MISHEELTRMRKNLRDMESALGSSTPQVRIPQEFLDALTAVEAFGESKYGKGVGGEPNWIQEGAPKTDHDSMHNSIFHHIAHSYSGLEADPESGLPPSYHAAYRLMMLITRTARGIK